MSYTFLQDVASRVPVPTDGTLSRVVFSNDRIRAVAFAFDTGQELTEHTASVPVVLQTLSGELEIAVASDELVLRPGDWLELDADVPHSVVAREPSVLLLTLLKG